MSDAIPIQAVGQVEANPIGCQVDALKPVISALNAELATHFTLYHQYLKHHWVVRGPQFRELHALLNEHYQQIQTDGDDLAERIVTLGGVPVSHPARQVELSAVEIEDDSVYPIRRMLENDLGAERVICQHLRLDVQKAMKVHDYGTEHLLKGILLHAEKRADNLDHLLAADSLEARLTGGAPGSLAA